MQTRGTLYIYITHTLILKQDLFEEEAPPARKKRGSEEREVTLNPKL